MDFDCIILLSSVAVGLFRKDFGLLTFNSVSACAGFCYLDHHAIWLIYVFELLRNKSPFKTRHFFRRLLRKSSPSKVSVKTRFFFVKEKFSIIF